MILDKHLELSLAQTVGASAASTNSIDLKAEGMHLGTGRSLYVIGLVTTAFTGGHSVSFQVQTHDDDSFGAQTAIGPAVAFTDAVVGYKFSIPIPPGVALGRFLRVYFTNADDEAGNVSMWLSPDPWADEAIVPDGL